MKFRYLLPICFVMVSLVGACGDETPSTSGTSSSSSSSGAGGEGGGGPDCHSDPKTHIEIINACTDAEKVDKVVNLPLLEADGSLPPLP